MGSRAESSLPQVLDIEEVADHLGGSVRHVRRLVAERRIPFVMWGKLLRFDPAQIAVWLDARRVTPRSVSYPLRNIGITRSTSAVAMVDRGLRRHGASS